MEDYEIVPAAWWAVALFFALCALGWTLMLYGAYALIWGC